MVDRSLHEEVPGSRASGTVSITVYAVPGGERSAAKAELEAKLPAVCDWIKRAEGEPPSWRMTQHALGVEMRHGQAKLVESDDL
jgi:hypothetical protein